MRIDTTEFGRIEISDVPLPGDARDATATYTYSGKVFVLYRRDSDPAGEDWYHAGVLEDDGTGFHPVFSGRIPQHPKANGVRHMMFADNRRVLLGDYVLECSPDVDTCTRARLVEVRYPWELEANPLITHHWSEIIVSPDNEHLAWTMLRSDMGAAAAIGRLRRTDGCYLVENAKLISTVDPLLPDPARAGHVVPQPQRGGEVKQFVRGGTAISIVGSGGGPLPDSVIQDLASEELIPLTRTPGYDETTILSPDERLGVVMTSRASERTDPAILGLLPRPHSGLTGMALAWTIYTYTVTGVRQFRRGNIGPVLIDIEKSRHEPGYRGVPLNDPDDSWVYVSPMSWHPDSRRALWLEMRRGTEQPGRYREIRVRKAVLLDREPQPPIATQPVPADIPYAVDGELAREFLSRPVEQTLSCRIAGRHSGYLEYERQAADIRTGSAGSSRSRYVDFSDDGRSVCSGYEQVVSSFTADTVYEADLKLTGEQDGELRLRATWSSIAGPTPARLLFDVAGDGKPKSHGLSRYGDRILRIEDLSE